MRWGHHLRTAGLIVLSVFFVAAGTNHFVHPTLYLGIIPPWVPAPVWANYISGGAEVLGGIGLLIPGLRLAAGWGLIALLIAVFPANIYAAIRGEMPGLDVSPLVLWLRLPFQAVFIVWVWWVAIRHPRGRGRASD